MSLKENATIRKKRHTPEQQEDNKCCAMGLKGLWLGEVCPQWATVAAILWPLLARLGGAVSIQQLLRVYLLCSLLLGFQLASCFPWV